MPLPAPERLLTSTARSTFESLALLYAEPVPAPGAALGEALDKVFGERLGSMLGGAACSARVAFAGVARGEAVEGVLAVAVTADVAAALAENMLGVAAAGPAERRDAVGEFANVVCGHVLSAAGGPEAVFSLAAPACADGGATVDVPCARDGAYWRAWLDVEGGRACVTLDAPPALFAESGHPAGLPA